MDNPGEILRLCRLCLVKDQVNIPIFEEQGDIRQIFLKISSCLPVKVSLEDKLPKRICDGCSNKLDLLYEFWNTSANAEKTLLSWLGQAGVKDADETISAVAQQIAKPAETQVKQEALDEGHASNQVHDSFGVQSFDEEAKDESEAPPPKRARRTAAVKAQINLTPESDEDDDMDSAEAMTKVEDESDESDGEDKDPSYGEIPGTSADDQAGPSGVGKDGVEAPEIEFKSVDNVGWTSSTQRNSKVTNKKNSTDSKIAELIGKKINVRLPGTKIKKKYVKKKKEKTWSSDEEDNWEDKELETQKENSVKKKGRKPRKCKENAKEKSSVLDKLSVKIDTELEMVDADIKGDSDWSDVDPDWSMDKDDLENEKEGIFKKTSKDDQLGKRKQDKSGLCPQCGKVVSDIRSHVKSHTNVFSCDLCFINFKNAKQLSEHREVHESDNPYNCDKCNMIFKNVTKLALHRFLHTGSYTCPICGFIATSKFRNSIIAHIKRHEDNYAVRCEICNKGFLCKKKLEEHIEWHENIPKYECEICHKKFPVKSYLKLHNKFNHKKELYGTEEIFQCELCGRKFTFEKSFKRHLSCIHKVGKDLTVKCQVCGKLIANNHNLKKHMRVHTGEKNYSCDVCGKTFSQKQYVTRHQRVHQADREGRKRSGGDSAYKIDQVV